MSDLLRAVEARLRSAGLAPAYVSASPALDGSVNVWVTTPGDLVLTDSGLTSGGDPVLDAVPAPASAPDFGAVAALFPGASASAALGLIGVDSL